MACLDSTERAYVSRAVDGRDAWAVTTTTTRSARCGRARLGWDAREIGRNPFEARAGVQILESVSRNVSTLSARCGSGWIGKNTCVINPSSARGCFSGGRLQPPLDIDAPALDQCGECTLCLEACPTQALVAPGVLDEMRHSGLMIEHRGEIPAALGPAIGSYVYGGDICQEVCPWNRRRPELDGSGVGAQAERGIGRRSPICRGCKRNRLRRRPAAAR